MIRVLRIINRFNLGGITYNVSYLSKYLPGEYETLLIGGPEEEGEESSLYIPESMRLQPLVIEEMRRSIDPFRDIKAYQRIKKIIKDFKPDIVHTHASKAGAIGRLAAIHCKVPVIVHTFHGHVFHGYFRPSKTEIFKKLERYLASKSTAIIAISELQKKELTLDHQICKNDKINVVPLGFDLKRFTEGMDEKRSSFRNRNKLENNELIIGIIGRLAPIKNHALFLEAIAGLKKESKQAFKALIIGDGETRQELEELVKQKEISDVVLFTGWIKEVDVALAGLDIVALSSKNEGTPVSLIEAQAAGKFVVSTNVGGISDILHPDCGLLSERDDHQGFINNLRSAVENFQVYNQKAGAARNSVLEKFSYQRLCRDMDNLYKKLLKENSKP